MQRGAGALLAVLLCASSVCCALGAAQCADAPASVLDALNALRARHAAPPVEYRQELCRDALSWAWYLANTSSFAHSSTVHGENLAMLGGVVAPERAGASAIDMWYSEIALFDFDDPNGNSYLVTGHFTQLVWTSTRFVGLGIAAGPGGTYVVMQFSPPGNYLGMYAQNVKRPVSAAAWPPLTPASSSPPPAHRVVVPHPPALEEPRPPTLASGGDGTATAFWIFKRVVIAATCGILLRQFLEAL